MELPPRTFKKCPKNCACGRHVVKTRSPKCLPGCTCKRHNNGPRPHPDGCTCAHHKPDVPCPVIEAHTGKPCGRPARPRHEKARNGKRQGRPMCKGHLARDYSPTWTRDVGATPLGTGPKPCPKGCTCYKHEPKIPRGPHPDGCTCSACKKCEEGCTCHRHNGKVYRNRQPNPPRTTEERAISAGRFTHEKAEAIINSHGWDALEEYPGKNDARWLVRHRACGEVVKVALTKIQPPPSGLTQNGYPYVGCPACGQKRQLEVFKEKEAKKAIDYMKAEGFELVGSYPGYDKPIQVLHDKCGMVVTSSYKRIKYYNGCPQCAPLPGLNSHRPTDLYLIRRKGVLKVGIYNTDRGPKMGNRRDRLQRHVFHGWTIARTWSFSTGTEARNIEQTVLKHWRKDLKAPAALEVGEMITGGETETVLTRKVGLQKTIDYIESQIPQTVVHS